ncbi:MAG: hypothetical protein IKU26_07370 [Clostridia bacterium]|nr:hypothetical protein [Clostridia bacterium]
MNREPRKAIQCTLKHHLGTLRENEKGWSREVNVVSWEGAASRLDIRDWSKNKDRSSKGVTFTRVEVERLRDMLAILNTSVIEDSGIPTRMQDVQVAYEKETNTAEQESEQESQEYPFASEEESDADEERAAV